jgi:hypothetical protein
MKLQFLFAPLLLVSLLSTTSATFAQAPAAAPPVPPAPLFFKETWKFMPGNIPMTQNSVMSPELTVEMFGAGEGVEKGFGVVGEGSGGHIWTGNCVSSCVLTLSSTKNFVDLSSAKAKIRWNVRTSGFHQIRPVLKLADGSYVIGDYAEVSPYDYHENEFYLSEVRWLKLDMPAVRAKGLLMDKVDLSKVDAVGFADLTPGSGHGFGGFSGIGTIEVYGTAVPRQ